MLAKHTQEKASTGADIRIVCVGTRGELGNVGLAHDDCTILKQHVNHWVAECRYPVLVQWAALRNSPRNFHRLFVLTYQQ
jgi:hypothetical protein